MNANGSDMYGDNQSDFLHEILLQNCRSNWPQWTCIGGNLCGLISTTLWFFVLLPQVWKNFRRKSVVGLSILWATANFTASLINFFFVYLYASIPLYGKINSVYMPVLEFTLILQFWLYGDQYSKRQKVIYASFCIVTWGTILSINLLLKVYAQMQWVAIGLWCIETFPQIVLNLKLHTTSGQAMSSVAIALVGKTTDFMSTYGLVLPLQYIIMTYFSSSVAYINGIQVVWYFDRKLPDKTIKVDTPSCPVEDEPDSSSYPILDDEMLEFSPADTDFPNVDYVSLNPEGYVEQDACGTICCQMSYIRWIILLVLSAILCVYVAGLVWATGSLFGLFAPFAIAVVVGTACFYYNRGSFSSFNVYKHLE